MNRIRIDMEPQDWEIVLRALADWPLTKYETERTNRFIYEVSAALAEADRLEAVA